MSGDKSVFVYGTLMAPEIFFSACYGDKHPHQAIRQLYTFTPAILRDHCRHRVKAADYPGAFPESGQSIKGIYITGLTDANMEKLDCFEGSEYERRTVKVQLLRKEGDDEIPGPEETAAVYIFLNAEDLERREWDFEEFRRDKMQIWTRGDWTYGVAPPPLLAIDTIIAFLFLTLTIKMTATRPQYSISREKPWLGAYGNMERPDLNMTRQNPTEDIESMRSSIRMDKKAPPESKQNPLYYMNTYEKEAFLASSLTLVDVCMTGSNTRFNYMRTEDNADVVSSQAFELYCQPKCTREQQRDLTCP